MRGTMDILTGMTKPDPTLAEITAQFTRHNVEWSRGAYMIIDRRTANPIARLRPIPETDRFELFYWSNVKGRWTTFGNLGRMKLMLESAHEIVENDPIPRPTQPMSPFKNWPKSSSVFGGRPAVLRDRDRGKPGRFAFLAHRRSLDLASSLATLVVE